MKRTTATPSEKQSARRRVIPWIIFDALPCEQHMPDIGAGNGAFHHSLKRMPLPFNLPGLDGRKHFTDVKTLHEYNGRRSVRSAKQSNTCLQPLQTFRGVVESNVIGVGKLNELLEEQ